MGKSEKKSSEKYIDKKIHEMHEKELEAFHAYMNSPSKMMLNNFLAGTAKGLGFFIGAAIIITILVFVLTKFLSSIPVVGDFFDAAGQWLEQYDPSSNNSID